MKLILIITVSLLFNLYSSVVITLNETQSLNFYSPSFKGNRIKPPFNLNGRVFPIGLDLKGLQNCSGKKKKKQKSGFC